jgi:hypothetical protein
LKIKRAKSTSTKGHYVTNAVLLPAVIEAKQIGKVTDKLIRMIMMIAERYSRKSNFIGYSFREDMVSAAVINLCNNALKFNLEKSNNPFSYYTTGIHNSFLQYMADEKKHRNIKDSLLIDAGSNPSFNFMQSEMNAEDHAEIKLSDDMVITDANPHETDELGAPPSQVMQETPNARKPSFSQQVFSSMDPGKPGKKRLSRFADLNPGPCITYKPKDYTVDPITGAITINVKPDVKPKVAAKKATKKSLRRAK